MADKEDKKKEEQEGTKKHKDKIVELMGGTEIIDNYIEAVSQRDDTVISENQKEVMKAWTMGMTEKWSEVLYKMEEAFKDPKVVEELTNRISQGALHETKKKK